MALSVPVSSWGAFGFAAAGAGLVRVNVRRMVSAILGLTGPSNGLYPSFSARIS